MGKDNLLSIGDVIKGDLSWSVWNCREDTGVFILTQEKQLHDIRSFDPDKVRIARDGYYTGSKTLAERVEEAGLRLVDKKFVVTYTAMGGGGTGHGPHDVYPDGWNVTAQTLKDDGNYDPDGLKVQFYQSGCFRCMITDVDPIGKMKAVYVPTTFVPAGP